MSLFLIFGHASQDIALSVLGEGLANGKDESGKPLFDLFPQQTQKIPSSRSSYKHSIADIVPGGYCFMLFLLRVMSFVFFCCTFFLNKHKGEQLVREEEDP